MPEPEKVFSVLEERDPPAENGYKNTEKAEKAKQFMFYSLKTLL